MAQSAHSQPINANPFHAGNTCPFCQETITEGQLIVKCNRCGSLHHESCWRHHHGCASYNCDEEVRRRSGKLEPEIVISADDAAAAAPPLALERPAGEDQSRHFLPPTPTRPSKPAIASLILAFAALTGIWPAVAQNVQGMALAVAVAVGSIAVGVVGMVVINTKRESYGLGMASAGVIMSAVLVIAMFAGLHRATVSRHQDIQVQLKISECTPTEAELARMNPVKANSLRANVVVRSSVGFLGTGVGIGSGIVMKVEDKTAYIITNKHVIGSEDAPAPTVLFYNGEESRATVVWRAPEDVDIALLSCQVLALEKTPSVTMRESPAAQGDPVFAVGNPMTLYWSYTEGVISAVRRRELDGPDLTVYQTQTPINQGNSGGGLYDMSGQLVGVNTWTKDKSVAEGLSFAIATTSIAGLLEQDGMLDHVTPGQLSD